jgi:hypothetical protein
VSTAAILLLAVLVAGIPAGVEAIGVKIAVNAGRDTPQGQPRQRPTERGEIARDPRQQYPDPRLQYPDPRLQYPAPKPQPKVRHRSVAPVVVITQPVYLTAPQSCVVPSYWAYTWVPQSYVSTVWVPGYYNYDALWIEGHYEPRAYTWGYYQPYWVPERAC